MLRIIFQKRSLLMGSSTWFYGNVRKCTNAFLKNFEYVYTKVQWGINIIIVNQFGQFKTLFEERWLPKIVFMEIMSVDYIVIDIALFLVLVTFNVVITEQGQVAVGAVVRIGSDYLHEFLLFLVTMLWFWWQQLHCEFLK